VLRAGERARNRSYTLEPGSKGNIGGQAYVVLGAMTRVDDEGACWSEYLLCQERGGFAWLTESDGTWWRARVMDEWPSRESDAQVRLGSTPYSQVERYHARVDHVLGAFNWRVFAGDEARVTEYEHGGIRLFAELTAEELTWTHSTRVTARQVADWFGLAPGAVPEAADVLDAKSMKDYAANFLLWMLGLNAIPLLMNFGAVWIWLLIGMIALVLPVSFG